MRAAASGARTRRSASAGRLAPSAARIASASRLDELERLVAPARAGEHGSDLLAVRGVDRGPELGDRHDRDVRPAGPGVGRASAAVSASGGGSDADGVAVGSGRASPLAAGDRGRSGGVPRRCRTPAEPEHRPRSSARRWPARAGRATTSRGSRFIAADRTSGDRCPVGRHAHRRTEERPVRAGGRGVGKCGVMADPTGFEPAISSVTGWHVGPLHHGSSCGEAGL